MGIRLLIIDDNPHVRWRGRVHPVNATFQRFAAGLLDLAARPVTSLTSCLPVRDVEDEPRAPPLDERIEVIATAPFEGIAGYLLQLPAMIRHNRPILRRAARQADLMWLKVPASNAPLAAAAARLSGVPRSTWVAGRATTVGAEAGRGAGRILGLGVGAAYDAAGWIVGVGGDRRVVGGRDGATGPGVVASLVDASEILEPSGPWPAIPSRPRLAWAGRLARGKGVELLFGALAALADDAGGPRYELVLIGDGRAAAELDALARDLGITDRIHRLGFIGDRSTYLAALRTADLFVFPSPAEGFPKVVLDAMAVGLPVVARPVGGVAPLVGSGIVAEAPTGSHALAAAVSRLVADPDRAAVIRAAGQRFVRMHTRSAELERIVAGWQARWPALPW